MQNETRKFIMKERVNRRNNPCKLDCNDGGKSIKDKNAISKILKVPVDVVERVLQDEKEEK